MKNVISLGCTCNVSFVMKRLNFRSKSYPFDWLITESTEKIFSLISNGFKQFLDWNLLIQQKKLCWFYNPSYGIYFYHDFTNFKRIYKQYPLVVEKYNRRIDRMYKDICDETVFIRQVHSAQDADYIAKNFDSIINTLHKFNSNNEILFISKFVINNTNVKYILVEDYKNFEKNKKIIDFLNQNINLDDEIIKNNKRRENKMKNLCERILHKIHFKFFSKIGFKKNGKWCEK